jgi:hypothetical protein
MLREMIFVKFVSGRYVFSERSEITPTGGLGQWVLFGAPISKSACRGGPAFTWKLPSSHCFAETSRRGRDRRSKTQERMKPVVFAGEFGVPRSGGPDRLKPELRHAPLDFRLQIANCRAAN